MRKFAGLIFSLNAHVNEWRHNKCRCFHRGHVGLTACFVCSMEMMWIICYDLHIHQMSSQLIAYLNQKTKWGNILCRMVFIPLVKLQRLVECFSRLNMLLKHLHSFPFNLSSICMSNAPFRTDKLIMICNVQYAEQPSCLLLTFLKVWTWDSGPGGCKMFKHSFWDSGRAHGTWLGGCDGEEGLQSVEAPHTQQSPLWIQRSANTHN